ncbi:hypothetical protein [Rhodococcus sp. NPDC058521]|uniref:hypothetical protein n=1 Tax=Rhodococcus sp. NPDC058521 TaxID=3346536 RepID=UPI00365F4B4B
MTALDKSTRRVATAVALVAGGALTLSACGAGQISQTATQVAAVNGNTAEVGPLALRNVHVVFPNSEEYSLEPGGDAVLAFSAINDSENTPEKLTGITTDFAGSVSIAGEAGTADIAPQTSLGAGTSTEDASGQAEADAQNAGNADAPSDLVLVVLEDLKEGVRPGLTIPVTFSFANAGDVTVSVPIDAGHHLERNVSDKSPVEAEGGH